jgi:LEA14-like dessication related protein
MTLRLLTGCLLLLGSACALAPKFEQPHLEVVGVEMLKSDLFRQELKVRLRVQNPNDRALPVRSISYQMEVEGEPFANGESERDFEIPALGTTEFDVGVKANMAGTLLRLLGNGKKPDAVNYRLIGKVALAKGLLRSIPFDQKGQLKIN